MDTGMNVEPDFVIIARPDGLREFTIACDAIGGSRCGFRAAVMITPLNDYRLMPVGSRFECNSRY